jgi:excinuclease UvrABC nuclease subunit
MGAAWRDALPSGFDNEIKYSMVRNEIENLTFRMKILSKMTPHYTQRMTDYNYY